MGQITLDAILAVTDRWHAAACDPDLLAGAVRALGQLFHASTACMGRQGGILRPGDVIAGEGRADFQQSYLQTYASHNLLWDTAGRMPAGMVYNDATLLGRGVLRGSLFWNEWMRPQDMYATLGCRIRARDGAHWILDIERGPGQDEFSSEEFTILRHLIPTVERTLAQREALGQLKLERDHSQAALDSLSVAVFLVAADGGIRQTNHAAEVLLRQRGAARRRGIEALAGGDTAAGARLQRLVAQACMEDAVDRRGSLLLLPDQGGNGPPMPVQVNPLPWREYGPGLALVLVRMPGLEESAESQIRAFFGLTEAEAKVAAALAAGDSAADIAERQGVRISTVRTHIGRIFQKTETHQQGQCVARLKDVLLPLRPF